MINEHILKLSSAGVSLPEPLEKGNRYLINTEVDIIETTTRDNQDGTDNLIYKGKQTGIINIQDHQGKIIKTKVNKKVSQSVRGAIWHYHNEQGILEDFDVYYERVGKKIAYYIPEIIKFLESYEK